MSNKNASISAAVMADNKTTKVSAYPSRNMKQDIWYAIDCTRKFGNLPWFFVSSILKGVKCEPNRIKAVWEMINHINKDYPEIDDFDIQSLHLLCGFYINVDAAEYLTVTMEHEIKTYLDLIN